MEKANTRSEDELHLNIKGETESGYCSRARPASWHGHSDGDCNYRDCYMAVLKGA